MTTHGDAVGPSAIPAVAPAPAPDQDAEQPTAKKPGGRGAKSGARNTSPAANPTTPGGTPTDAPGSPTGDPADGAVATPPGAPASPAAAPSAVDVEPPSVGADGPAEQPDAIDQPPSPAAASIDGDATLHTARDAVPASATDPLPEPVPDPDPKAVAVPEKNRPLPEPADDDAAAPAAIPSSNEPTAVVSSDEPTAVLSSDEPTAVVVPGDDASEPATELIEPPDPQLEPTLVDLDATSAATQPHDEEPGERADAPESAVEQAASEDRSQDGSPAPGVPAEPPAAVGRLAAALTGLRSAIGGTAYPLVMPSADDARRVGAALVSQLDDYLLPRLARLDAPLLVVVGGSTGAGKSTLVNSLVRAPVSSAGVLRPTTRSPVLVCHPSDSGWFRKGDLLPGMTRTTESSNDPKTLQLVVAPALGPGLAFLDAPDIDSVVDQNRALAAQLLAAADLWLFVTTAARYADAVPWELLRTARLRGTVTALVLDRVPPEAAGEISAHLSEMLAAQDMAEAPLFVLPETSLDGQGLLSEDVTRPLHDWFAMLAADANARAVVVRQTLDGALSALGPAVDGLAAAADEQAVAAKALDERVTAAYRNGRRTVEQGLQDGRLLRGEVLARWQEFVGTGEFLRGLESRVGRFRDRVVAAVTGRPAPGSTLQVALESQIVTLLRGVAADAAEQAYTGWQAHPAGAALLTPELGKASPELPERAERLVRDWQRGVLELVRTEAGDKRFVARSASYAVNATGLAVMIAVFTSTAFIPTGAEIAVGAGTTVAAQKVLEAIFGDQAIRTLAARAREDLLTRVDTLLDAEAARYAARTESVGLDVEPGAALRRAADTVATAREELALTTTPAPSS